MKIALVGYTGFVGSNILLESKGKIDYFYNTKNIELSYGLNPDLLIYAGIRAEKYIANNSPEEDYKLIIEAQENIKKINPKKIVLISTVDVYKLPFDVYENDEIVDGDLAPYGKNRLELEEWVKSNYVDYLIIRLPGLFGKNIKKNFIYDYLHPIPKKLSKSKFFELKEKDSRVANYYKELNNGFFEVNILEKEQEIELTQLLDNVEFSSLLFTDSRNIYQFYNLKNLWNDINLFLENDVHLINLATEPISISELYLSLEGKEYVNFCTNDPVSYNFKTIYSKKLRGVEEPYLYSKDEVLRDIVEFVRENKN